MQKFFEQKVSKGESKRKQILETVIDLINSEGIDKVTFDFVGKSLNMRPSHVAYYFRNRRKLIGDALQHVAEVAQQITAKRVAEATSWEERASAIIEGAFEWLEKYPTHASAMTLFYYYCTCDSEQRQIYSKIKKIGLKRLMTVLEPAVAEGRVPAESLESLSSGIQSLLVGNILHVVTTDTNRSTKKRVKEETTRLAFNMLRGFSDVKKHKEKSSDAKGIN